jgi:hypothetical protein
VTALWWASVACYTIGCLCIPEAWHRGPSRRFWILFACWVAGLCGLVFAPEPARSAERTYTFTIPRVGNRGRCTAAETLYTIDSVRVLRYRRMPNDDPWQSAPWVIAQQQRPAIMFQSACRAGDAMSVTLSLADTGWVNEFTVHNWVTTLDGRVFGAWGDACGATVRAW